MRKITAITGVMVGIHSDQKVKQETWIAVDEYRDQQAYDRMYHAYRSTGKVYEEFGSIVQKWNKLIVPSSVEIESWFEKPEFRLQP